VGNAETGIPSSLHFSFVACFSSPSFWRRPTHSSGREE